MLRFTVPVTGALVAAFALFVGGAAGSGVSQDSFPVSIVASNGKVTVSKKPRRIVSLSPTATESLFAVGAGAQVVAVHHEQAEHARAAHSASSGSR